MLQLKHISKSYTVGDTVTKAQNDVSVAFRQKEFVAILGPSGSGKTTMLNIIGGLDRYDSGDLLIKGKSTKNFKDSDWDAYRNNSVGFIFQSYNLITHLSILENVEMGMTLSGVSTSVKRQKATDALIRVGLKDQIHKQPNQLSGGQMQRVAIARAIANDPEILLADEPTGALDSETSLEIMDLIRDLSHDRLVIMVTHNPDLAKQYADRIIRFADGQIQADSAPYEEQQTDADFSLTKTKMSYWTALKLSFTNIKTKKGRTFLTIFASSIGIIGVAVVLALSNGFQKQVNQTQSETLSTMPVTVAPVNTDTNAIRSNENASSDAKGHQVRAEKSNLERAQHTNKLNQNYLNYLKKMPKKDASNIAISYGTGMNLIRKVNGKYQQVTFSNADPNNAASSAGLMFSGGSSSNTASGVYPVNRDGKQSFLRTYYRLLDGKYPTKATDIVLVADKHNAININGLRNLGVNVKDGQTLKYQDLVGMKIKMVANDDYYRKLPTGSFLPARDYSAMANKSATRTLTVSGIIRVKSNNSDGILPSGVAYSANLTQTALSMNRNSKIAKAQKGQRRNVTTGQSMNGATRSAMLTSLGASTTPTNIQIYPTSFKKKDQVLAYLKAYNKGKPKSDQVRYTDLASTISAMTGGVMDAITDVLVALAGISLITSMIMIAIITYTSVLERTKEIGVLKALGARKKDITRVFDAETFILGFGAGIFGILIAYLLTFPINSLLLNITGLSGVAVLNPIQAVVLIIISTILTLMGGHIPARMAAKKDAAIALRAE
ncbi:ATP-binding cassette domain-containing protein [Secundilactobacillus folii]|uniref:ATP-binding cassette domain-containing protein n=1 Tax=Secundilactobacillus folii TaxID=2678357 RepID=A0A7X2XTT6_9LACO|nr:ABC transporter ATP-binding protein/permease [Secundilactobacillus folii]MTV81476.1 ATP-binding cassette domain-containing protein [Secundilactobacillus folii]